MIRVLASEIGVVVKCHRSTRVGPWRVLVENSEPISAHGVSHIVPEFSEFIAYWADVRGSRWPNRVLLQIKPEAVSWASSSMVSNPDIVWICHPESSRSGVSVQDTVRCSHSDYEIICDIVVSLDTIFDEDVVALAVMVDVSLNA